ncbi:ABC transporter permease [Candidatus Cryosericum septentrionale]|jgi:peptide/nickel transport system permease protein|uniref:ABC transporter permease n=1 Tax=Candidatus Cryosericum septentrionale TaxID=2290913 RepID=A0A398DNX1_9BACT|nr:ABC transporter permease [Candidatus Cryosericum septentrionale]
MSLPSWLAKRLGEAVIVLVGLSILLFCITRILPGDPARIALGPRVPESAVEDLRKQMNLDKPLPTQYFLWVKGVLRGDFGMSLLSRRAVVTDIKAYFPATLEEVILAAILQFAGGIGLGILAAKYADTWLDGIVRVVAYLGIATPSFVWGIVLLLLLGYWIPILPIQGRISPNVTPPPHITGMFTVDSLLTGKLGVLWDSLKHLILPALALALAPMSQAARLLRSSMCDDMEADHVYAMRAYGVPENRILTKYLARLAFIPAISVMSLDAGSLFASAFVVESVFNFPGLSRFGMQAILNKDLNSIAGILLLVGVLFVLIIILADLIVAYLDPRTRLQQRG